MISFVNLMHSRITWEENLRVELSGSGGPGARQRGLSGLCYGEKTRLLR